MANSKNKAAKPAAIVIGEVTLTDEQATLYGTFDATQQETFAAIVALPPRVSMATVAATLGRGSKDQQKQFRGWLRSVRKCSVTGNAAGCDHNEPTVDDYLASVARWVKTTN